MKTEGQFLHCSSRKFGDVGFHVLKNKSVMELALVCIVNKYHFHLRNSFELTLSATESALTILLHYRPMDSHDPKTFKVLHVLLVFKVLLLHIYFFPGQPVSETIPQRV